MAIAEQAPSLRREDVRSWFPSLASGFAYLENAGGSQVPGVVADAIRDYMLTSYVQLGAGYAGAKQADAVVADAHDFIETFMNAQGVGRVVLGPSTTALTLILANCYADTLRPGDEVVVAETNHESNAGPWARLERRGATVRMWKVDPATFSCSLENLRAVLSERTRIVALPHVSNLIGQIEDVRAVCELAHSVGARVVADGVAYAPHRAIDVRELGVDWYVYSTYKVYGPHMAALFGRDEAFAEIEGPNHFFIAPDAVPYRFELGGVSHEGCAGLLALRAYLGFLAGGDYEGRTTVERAFATMESLERPLQDRLLAYLRSRDDLRIIGPAESDGAFVGTISFLHQSKSSDDVVEQVHRHNVGIRHGHMYAYRLCQALGIDPEPGVVRASLLHYNTEDEIERLIQALDAV
jgi:cysteine desulfurase family protein (TIGR01976 family)